MRDRPVHAFCRFALLNVLAVAVLCAASCAAGPRAGPAANGPARPARAAARAFFESLDSGKVESVRAAVLAGEDEEPLIQAIAEMAAARRRLAAAAGRRFRRPVPGLADAARSATPDYADAGVVSVDGDRATLARAPGDPRPVPLRNAGGTWKVDLAEMSRTHGMAANLPRMQAVARAANRVASDIADGRYETPEQAVAAYEGAVGDLVREAQLPAPKAAAWAFLRALREGDLAAAEARAVVTGTEDADLLKTLAEHWGALAELNAAGTRRFGRAGFYRPNSMAHRFAHYVETGKLTGEGDQRVIEAPDDAGMYPRRLRRVKGEWRVVVASLRETNAVPELIPSLKLITAADRQILKDLEAGRYRTAEAFRQAVDRAHTEALLGAQ